MAKKPILVVMAAGMGSRYGGLKQIDAVGTQGEAILDYSLYDAWKAGFETAVIIIKEAIRETFMETVGKRLEKCPLEIRYAYQELDHLPAGFTVPEGRTKPWGTSHAVLCAAEAIDGAPFAVINADDFYGRSAFFAVFNALSTASDGDKFDYCMVGYPLKNTVSNNGAVTRGICQVENGQLAAIVEQPGIEIRNGAIGYQADNTRWLDLPADTTVSMNLWGFTPSLLSEIEARFPKFLQEKLADNPDKCEYYLPMLVGDLLQEEKARVRVLRSEDQWHGVTYTADKPLVMAAIAALTTEGKYPNGLWK